ncbi:nuclear transport factor 2 family protein [Novosphingobium sp. PS1R-30]|uniref:Nuclear transport factor 2 family protein n=1 Tax=Novosphingobium anseongense TaxID=3133436 RepID=A0ABU8RYX4_9SPHN|nr:MAG: nuclear transport factor 2 family protein [Novosphingobium sp.]
MAIVLPQPIADYFSADAGSSADAIAQCFTPTAVVKDEGRTYTGRAAIHRWKVESSAKYTYTSEPRTIAEENGRMAVTNHLVGDFPGSPADLRYFFVLDGQKIAELEVIP